MTAPLIEVLTQKIQASQGQYRSYKSGPILKTRNIKLYIKKGTKAKFSLDWDEKKWKILNPKKTLL